MRDVSIIIPSYNRPDDLDVVLPYYFAQDDIKEIIIIDDGSAVSYQYLVKKYSANENVDFIYYKNSNNMGAAAGRNIGLSLASGKYILWGEDDAFPSKNYVSVLKSKIDERKVIFGSIYYGIYPVMSKEEKENNIAKQQCADKPLFDYELMEGYYRIKTNGDVEVPWGHALLMVEKSAYSNVNYYEGYKINGYREETDAQVQILKAGYSIIYTSDTCCYHFPARNKKGGQHSSNMIRFELYKIINNNLFLDRNYDFIRQKFGLSKPLLFVKIIFIRNEIHILTKKVIRKIVKRIKREK